MVQNLKIDSLILIENSLYDAIYDLERKDKVIVNKYEKIYLNPNTTDWNKLDSLSSIILNRQSRSGKE